MEIDRTLREKTAYCFFYAGLIIEVLIVLVDKSAYTNPIEGQIFRLTFLLFFAKVCLTKYSPKEYGILAFFLVIGAVSYFITGRNEIVRVVMFIAACKDVDMRKCLRLVFWMTLTGCLVLILLSLFGILGTLSLTQDYGRGSIETRYVLGMGHPNALQCMVFVLTLLGLYLYHTKWKWYHYVLVLFTNGIFFLLTDSKTGFLVSACGILLFFVADRIKNKNLIRIFMAGNMGIFAGSIIISIMSAKDAMCLWHYYWEGVTNRKINFYLFLDTMLTGRLHSLIETDNHEGIMETWRLFSRPENNYYFDMGWVRLFYWYGIIPALLAIAVLTGFMIYFAKKGKLEEIVFFSMFTLYTVIEAHIISVYIARNYLLFIIGMYCFRRLEKPKE
ncbi:MAG: hypothetical protein HDQ97_01800 [Lachnospiraceae bacterium]|nr:hypothetical protein [Lachnospiraceae bacterium]